MPPLRGVKSRRPPPEGFSDIEDTLLSYANKMRDATSTSTSGTTPRNQHLWPIFQITHQRSRYIWDLYSDGSISKQLYDWLLKNKYADATLIAKWKKQGYEMLCCTRCVQTNETNFGGTCVCRVPKAQLAGQTKRKKKGKAKAITEGGGEGEEEEEEVAEEPVGGAGDIQCVNCGCRGCASGD